MSTQNDQLAQNNVLIELHVPDFRVAKDFYGKLGFRTVWERKPEGSKGYLVMKMEDNILCFWGGNSEIYTHPYFRQWSRNTKRGYATEIVVMVKNIESYYKSIQGLVNIVEDLKKQPWGLKDFRIEDSFGFYIRVTSYHNILDSKYSVS